jgi:hypothetical protein
MTTHLVNQELAKHHYATLAREANSHRLAREAEGMSDGASPSTPSTFAQMTWALQALVRGRSLRPVFGSA